VSEKNKVNWLYLSGTPLLGLDLGGWQDTSRPGSAGHEGLCKRKLRSAVTNRGQLVVLEPRVVAWSVVAVKFSASAAGPPQPCPDGFEVAAIISSPISSPMASRPSRPLPTPPRPVNTPGGSDQFTPLPILIQVLIALRFPVLGIAPLDRTFLLTSCYIAWRHSTTQGILRFTSANPDTIPVTVSLGSKC
jgi:hypothetical protein